MFSNSAKKTPINVGKNSYRVVSISDTTIRRISEESVNGDLFGSSALDEVKSKLKTGISLGFQFSFATSVIRLRSSKCRAYGGRAWWGGLFPGRGGR